MSWDIELCDPVSGAPLDLGAVHQMSGGTICIGGTSLAELNVTYNYGKHFNFSALDGKTATESMDTLHEAANRLGNDVNADYWIPTEGNVKRAIKQLLAFAQLRPDGIWKVI